MAKKFDINQVAKRVVDKATQQETNKEKLKSMVIQYPREVRKGLENYIEENLSVQDISDALQLLAELNEGGKNHNIVGLSHGEAGFSVKTEFGVTFAR